MDGEYPILEFLFLMDAYDDSHPILILPETLETPHIRHLFINCSIPIRSLLLRTAAGLINLYLVLHHPSTYFEPTVLLQCLSSMPQLEILLIVFQFPVPNRDVERQLMRRPIMTHVTLPNLRFFVIGAVSAYSEAVLSRITDYRPSPRGFPNMVLQATHVFSSTTPAVHGENRKLPVRPCRVRLWQRES